MGGSKTKSTTNQQTTAEIPQEIRDRGTKITTAAMDTYFDPAKKYQPFSYGDYADVGKDTTGQLNNWHSKAGADIDAARSSYQPYINRADQTATQGAANNQASMVDGPNFNSAAVEKFMNPYSQFVIDRGLSDIGRAMNSQRLENQSRAAVAGAFGGARHGVIDAESQRTAADTAQNFVGQQLNTGYDKAVNQYNTDYGQGLQANAQNNASKQQNWNQAAALSQIYSNLGNQKQAQQLAGSKAAMDYGNLRMAQEQAQKDNAYEKGYLDKRDYPMQIYRELAGLNAMQPVNRTSTTTGTSTQKSSGGWVGPALGALGAFMSDETAKEDIKPISAEKVLEAYAKIEAEEFSRCGQGGKVDVHARDISRSALGARAKRCPGLRFVRCPI